MSEPEHIREPINRIFGIKPEISERVWQKYEAQNNVKVPVAVRLLAETMLALEMKAK